MPFGYVALGAGVGSTLVCAVLFDLSLGSIVFGKIALLNRNTALPINETGECEGD